MLAPGTALGPRALASHTEPSGVGYGFSADFDRADDAQRGSTALANHCLRAFDRFAERHGIGADEAKILLLDTGIRL